MGSLTSLYFPRLQADPEPATVAPDEREELFEAELGADVKFRARED